MIIFHLPGKNYSCIWTISLFIEDAGNSSALL